MRTFIGSIVMLVASPLAAQGVDSPSPVQILIDRALPGDTIIVQPGTYAGDIRISKPVALIGMDRPILRGSGKGSCVTVSAPGCLIQGFVIEGSGSNLMNEDAGVLIRSDGNTVVENELRDILFGIYLYEADSNRVVRNSVRGRGHLDYGQRGSGIHIWNSYDNEFSGNVLHETRDGFYIQYASRTTITENVIFDTRYGVHYMYADSNSFTSNQFYANVAGAALMYSRALRFRHNVFAHNRGFASYGVLFQDCHNVVADSNLIADNVVGMFFEASTGNIVRHNVIAQNDLALQMFQNSTGNTFAENNFVDNLNPLIIVGKRTESHWSLDGRGNYWSSYGGYDLDADGVGDVPMKIQNVFNYLEGKSPNLRLYLYSPAAQALAVASSAFPILDLGREMDDAPLMNPVDVRSMPAVHFASEPRRPGKVEPILAGFAAAASLMGVIVMQIIRKRS